MLTIEVESFGDFRVLVNGQSGPTIKSRYARELLLVMSMARGPTRRERLVDQLLPKVSDHRHGRRRLTQELSRLQSAFDFALWETTPETVAVHPDLHLSSDLDQFLTHESIGRSEHASRWRHRLVSLARIADRGPLLPGHDSPWSENVRSQATARELIVRQELATSLSPSDQPTALRHARRWVELDPFADDAHLAVFRLIHAVLGEPEARRYREQWTELSRAGLGIDPPDLLTDGAAEAARPPLLRQQLVALEDELAGADGEDRWRVLVEMDDVVRIIGDGPRRQAVLDQLIDLATRLDRQATVSWRQAEFAHFSGDVALAMDFADTFGTVAEGSQNPESSSSAMESVTRALIHFYNGHCSEALAAAEDAIRQCDGTSTGIEIEARLWISRSHDHAGDNGEALEAAVHALDLANRLGADHYTAEALAAVGWCLAKTDHVGEAQSTLDEAIELAERLECNIVRATALGSLGFMNYLNRRPVTAYAQMAEAAELSERIGHAPATTRWLLNAIPPLDVVGRVDLSRRHFDQVQALPSLANDHCLAARLLFMEALVGLSLDDPLRALDKCTEALARLEKVDEPAQQLFTERQLAVALLEAGRTTEAVDLASATLAEAEKQNMPPYLKAGFSATLGYALVKDGSTADGMAMLQEFMAHRHPGQILDGPECGAYFEAALKLGMTEEREALARTTCRMVDSLRQDLTDEQWETAKKRSFYVRSILPILDSVGYR